MSRMIDVTPTWRGLLPAMIYGARNGTTIEARKVMRDELMRMIRMSDDSIDQAALLELIELQYTSTSFEAGKLALSKLEAYADAADEAVKRSKAEEEDAADDEPDGGETYLPRDEGAPPRSI